MSNYKIIKGVNTIAPKFMKISLNYNFGKYAETPNFLVKIF